MDLTPNAKLIPGVLVEVGGTKLIVPPLNLRAVREFLPKLAEARSSEGEGRLGAALDITQSMLLAALQRNYPNIDMDFIEENFDLALLDNELLPKILRMSGIRTKDVGEDGPAQPRPTITSNSGTTSTPSSSSPQDGPTTT